MRKKFPEIDKESTELRANHNNAFAAEGKYFDRQSQSSDAFHIRTQKNPGRVTVVRPGFVFSVFYAIEFTALLKRETFLDALFLW